MGVQYNRDLIAERDSKNKLHNSVVKWWQVNYEMKQDEMIEPEEEAPAANPDVSDEDRRLAEEVFARLSAEKAADDAIFQAKIDQAFAEAEAAEAARLEQSNYNATTGSYSGAYGINRTMDTEKKNTVDSIMGEKDAVLRALIDNAQN